MFGYAGLTYISFNALKKAINDSKWINAFSGSSDDEQYDSK